MKVKAKKPTYDLASLLASYRDEPKLGALTHLLEKPNLTSSEKTEIYTYLNDNFPTEIEEEWNLSNMSPLEILGFFDQINKKLSWRIQYGSAPVKNLHLLNPEQTQAFIIAVKDFDWKKIKISFNKLNESTPEQWKSFWAYINEIGITSLDLPFNCLDTLSTESREIFFQGVKESQLEHLGLGYNDLEKYSTEDWQTFLANLKDSGLITLDLSGVLYKMNYQNLEAFSKAVKESDIVNIDLITQKPEPEENLETDAEEEDPIEILQAIINDRRKTLASSSLKQACLHTLWQLPNARIKEKQFISDASTPVELDDASAMILSQGGAPIKTYL